MSGSLSEHGIDRVGIGTDLHRIGSDRPLVLGGVEVSPDGGAFSHSDGDVLLHALIDALLGAAGLGDIGELFPDTDRAYKDADSRRLLSDVLTRVTDAGYAVVNVDTVVHAERPKLSPHKQQIRESVASLLSLPIEAVSIKAKTHEGVDAVGAGQAIACTAVAGLRYINRT